MTGNGTNKSIDARSLTLPVITIISILGFVMWVTYVFTTEIAAGRGRLTSIESTLIEVKSQIKALGEDNSEDKYLTAHDITVFCLRAQLMNKDWRCPSIDRYNSLNRFNDADILRELQKLNHLDGDDKGRINQDGKNPTKEADIAPVPKDILQ